METPQIDILAKVAEKKNLAHSGQTKKQPNVLLNVIRQIAGLNAIWS